MAARTLIQTTVVLLLVDRIGREVDGLESRLSKRGSTSECSTFKQRSSAAILPPREHPI
ncbi:hypothetical protein [Halorubrum laminariae]|uniref:Uncharacterized protein n=1 Tax=Halorubrum laminariae TaxID=1433523 RepID=A0ABD6BW40_9EURY|nr:hypothetical protein [Halorubrum laminariae]